MRTMQPARLWLIGGVLAALVMVLVAYFAFIGPQYRQTNDKNAQVSEARTHNDALQQRIDRLRVQNVDLASYQDKLKQAKLALPDTSGLADFLRMLQSLGNATQTDVSSLTAGAPTDVTLLPGTPAAAKAAPASTRVYALPITAKVSGSRAELEQFLTQLQTVQPRAVLISQIIEGPSATNPKGAVSLELTMRAFVSSSNAAELAALSAGAR